MATGGNKRRVVIVGGGIAGSKLAMSMQFDSHVVLIDSKEYLEIPWAKNRSMVEPSFAEKALINHTEYLRNAKIITSPVVGITESEVLTAENQSIAYDYLVIATGHIDYIPRNREDRLAQFQQENKKIKSSSSVLIIGGGRMGVELAGEIAVDFPGKKVTLVHKGSRLLEILGPKASRKALKWLTSKGVEVILDQSIGVESISEGDTKFVTSAGTTITADCHYVCVGRPSGSSWLANTILKDSLDSFGKLQVDESFRVKGRKNIFAIGDIININEIKQGVLAQGHATLVAKNLKKLMAVEDESKLAVYKTALPIAFVSLGRKEAVVQLPFATLIGRFPGLFKSKNLFVGWTREQIGLNR